MRKLILCAMVGLMIVVPTVHGQGGDPAGAASEWLTQQQQPDGSFAGKIDATAYAVIALAAMGEKNDAALDWLEANFTEELALADVSVMLMAVIASGTSHAQFAGGDLLTTQIRQLRQEQGEMPDTLCLGLLARHNLGIALPGTLVETLVELQNDDGGFGDSADTESDPRSTGLCLQALVAAEETAAAEQAVTYLAGTQLDDDGWAMAGDTLDPYATAFAVYGLIAAGETLNDWGNPEWALMGFHNNETGAFGQDEADVLLTAIAIPIFRGRSLLAVAPEETTVEHSDTALGSENEGPPLDDEWAIVGNGFQMPELNTADDFFITVIDPFTGDELYGVEIINWTASYTYTPYIVENYMTADILLWMGDQDPTTWDKISNTTLELLPADELSQLPEDVQARIK